MQKKTSLLARITRFFKHEDAGFTLVELLVVIVILGLLATVGIGSFSSAQMKSRDARRKADIKSTQNALEIYFSDKGQYPLGDGLGNMLGCGNEQVCGWGGAWIDDNGTMYMQQLPEDPKDGEYFYISDGEYYQIYAHLENERDPDAAGVYSNPGENSCAEGGCNYGKSSTNVELGKYE